MGDEPRTEASRFEAFRLLPDTAKLDLLAYCVALTLQPKLSPASGEETTAYDAALALTGASVAAYWRPTGANFLSRIGRDQLLAVARETALVHAGRAGARVWLLTSPDAFTTDETVLRAIDVSAEMGDRADGLVAVAAPPK